MENALSLSLYRQDLREHWEKCNNCICLHSGTLISTSHSERCQSPNSKGVSRLDCKSAISDNRASLLHQDKAFNENKIKLLGLLSTSKNIACVPEQLQMRKISRSTAKMSSPVSQFHKLD